MLHELVQSKYLGNCFAEKKHFIGVFFFDLPKIRDWLFHSASFFLLSPVEFLEFPGCLDTNTLYLNDKKWDSPGFLNLDTEKSLKTKIIVEYPAIRSGNPSKKLYYSPGLAWSGLPST